MRLTRTRVALLLLGMAFLLGAWWTVTAQEGLRPPAPVRPPSLATPSLRMDDHPARPAPPLYDAAPLPPKHDESLPPVLPLPQTTPMPSAPAPSTPPMLPLPSAPSIPPVMSMTTPPVAPSAPLPLTTPMPENSLPKYKPALPNVAPADVVHHDVNKKTTQADGSEEIIIASPEDIQKYQSAKGTPPITKPAAPPLPIIRDEPGPTAKLPIVRVQQGEESGAPPVKPIDDKGKPLANPLEVPTFPPPPGLVSPPSKTIDAPPAFPPFESPPMLPKQEAPPLTAPLVPPKQEMPSTPPKTPSEDIPPVVPSVPLQRSQPNTTPAAKVAQPQGQAEKSMLIGPATTPSLPIADPIHHPQRITTPQGEPLLEMNVKTQLFRNGQGPTHSPPMPNIQRGGPPLVRPHETKAPLDNNIPTTPLVTVVKKGPATQTTGGVVQYHIHVKNVGHYAAQQVRVVDEIPPSIRLEYSDPVPTKLEGGKASWDIAALQPGEERTLRLDLKPLRPGAVVSTATVHVSARYPFKLDVNGDPIEEQRFPPDPTPILKEDIKPELKLPQSTGTNESKGSLRVRAPDTGTVGSTVMYEILIANTGTQPLTNLKLWVKLPEGLFHKAGKDIIADLPAIPAGKTEKFEVPVNAVKLGKHLMHFRITGVTGEPWHTSHEIMLIGSTPVNMPLPLPPVQKRTGSLNLRVSPVSALALKREGEIRIDVTNEHSETVKQMQVTHVLPEGVDLVSVGDLGMYQPVTRTASWIVPVLAPGESKTVSLRVMPQTPGQLAFEVVAKSSELGDVKSEQTLAVEGISNLGIRLAGRDGNLPIGKDTVYEVRVLNEGSAAATNLRVQVAMPVGMQPHKLAQGPTNYTIEGTTITFDPLARLAPGTQMVYHVGGRAVAAGDHRIRAAVASEQQPTPLVREVQTMAFQAQ